MWPWEHLAFGYVIYSALSRLFRRESPGDAAALALAVGTQLPDLVDKPLSWTFGLTATGYGPAHSLLVGGPALVLAPLVADRFDRPRVGSALAVGYVSHLVGDLLALRAGFFRPGRLLWPLASHEGYAVHRGFLDRFALYFGKFVATATDPDRVATTLVYAVVFLVVVGLWYRDGMPVADALYRRARRAVR